MADRQKVIKGDRKGRVKLLWRENLLIENQYTYSSSAKPLFVRAGDTFNAYYLTY